MQEKWFWNPQSYSKYKYFTKRDENLLEMVGASRNNKINGINSFLIN